MNAKTAELTTNILPRTVQNLNGLDSRDFRKKIFSMGYEYISLSRWVGKFIAMSLRVERSETKHSPKVWIITSTLRILHSFT